MSTDRSSAATWASDYGRTWSSWDVEGFVALFTEDVVYVDHPSSQAVRGREALRAYVLGEREAQGEVTVRIGSPLIDNDRVAAEFWASARDVAIAGGFIAHLDREGLCSFFREYWFELDAAAQPFAGWGT